MLTKNILGKIVPLFFATTLATAQSSVSASRHPLQIPARPAALFSGEQGQQQTEVHFDPATNEVTMKLLVQDPAGYFIPALHRDNFAIFEDGVRQHNATVEVEHAPITLGIVMEHGGRYQGFNKSSSDEVLRAGEMLLDEIGRNDKVALWEYGDGTKKIADFGTAHDRLDQFFLSSDVPDSSETNFYDALVTTSKAMKEVSGRKALIFITSGVDTFSKAKYAEALEAVRASGTPVYIINLGPDLRQVAQRYSNAAPYARLDWQQTQRDLEKIAKSSGGRMYAPSSLVDLTGLYDDLMENLRVRYVISYHATHVGSLESARTVRVELVDPHGGPLEIIDSKGKVIRSKVIVETRYVPNSAG